MSRISQSSATQTRGIAFGVPLQPSPIKSASYVLSGVVAVSLLLLLADGASAASSNRQALTPLNRLPRMVQEYLVDQVRQAEQQGDQRRAAMKSRQDAEAYIRDVQDKIQRCFGPWPEKTPLNPRITGVLERDQYRIEKVIFESRPGFLVTGNLYIPKGRPLPLPGVVGTCGHSDTGKAYEAYQGFAQGLARQGYVVLIFDPIGQGERLQYPNGQLKSRIGVGVREHLYGGNQQFLVGEFFGAWRAWDGIRALDYLLTRPEVDPKQIGVTGCSGGGTMTTWLCGVDRRWTMAAPSCFVTTFLRNCENELPADTEQCPPMALALGLDHSDFIAAMAPKPIILLTKEGDFFDVRGGEKAYADLRQLYRLLGVQENIALFTEPGSHGYTQKSREAMYRWFNRATRISDAQTEPNLTIEKDETLLCAPKGQVCELNSKPMYAFTAEKAKALAAKRPKEFTLPELRQQVRTMLRLPAPEASSAPDYRILRNWRSRGYPKPRWTTYLVETEPGIQAVVYRLGNEQLIARPHASTKQAILYVAHQSSDTELRDEPLLREIIKAEPSTDLYTVDVRGIGESRPDTCDENSFFDLYGSDYFYAIHSIMLDRPYIGQRTHDVLRVLDWLGKIGYDEVHIIGKGWGALPATFAAVLSDRVKQVTLKNALTSYQEIAESQDYAWPLSTLVPNVLSTFDLPDCYQALQSKNLRQIDPWGPAAKPIAN
ncbi:MAG: prolyl oligopeptidase family serine peptidase [Phycisphaerae bacterium]|nr:prolyl oligopeptidase family serine peptidase [Phycisphaerae bacterium]